MRMMTTKRTKRMRRMTMMTLMKMLMNMKVTKTTLVKRSRMSKGTRPIPINLHLTRLPLINIRSLTSHSSTLNLAMQLANQIPQAPPSLPKTLRSPDNHISSNGAKPNRMLTISKADCTSTSPTCSSICTMGKARRSIGITTLKL